MNTITCGAVVNSCLGKSWHNFKSNFQTQITKIKESIYLTITRKAKSANLPEDCSLSSPKLIYVAI